jgi:hypothetical protein
VPSYVPFKTVTVGSVALATVASNEVANAPTFQALERVAMMLVCTRWEESSREMGRGEAVLVYRSYLRSES